MKIWKLLSALPLALLLVMAMRLPASAQSVEEMSTPVPPSVQIAEIAAPDVITPTVQPTDEPTKGPTEQPTDVPTETPTVTPVPTVIPKPTPWSGKSFLMFLIKSLVSEERICSLIVWADPRYTHCVEDMVEADWEAGTFVSHFGPEPDGEYTIELTGNTDPEKSDGRHAYSAALIAGGQELIFRFQQLFYERDDQDYVTPIFHNALVWTGESTLRLDNLGSYKANDSNEEEFELIVEGQDAETITWDQYPVGTQITLTDGTEIVISTFSDYRNEETPAFAIRRGCIGIVALREQTGFRHLPTSGKILYQVFPGCDGMDGFMHPLFIGEDVPGDPNDYKRSNVLIEAAFLKSIEVDLYLKKLQ